MQGERRKTQAWLARKVIAERKDLKSAGMDP